MKKQTLVLVVIAVLLFVAGSAIAFVSVEKASKQTGSGGNTTSASTTPAVVAKSDIPAGTTGQAMISNKLVAVELIPTKSYSADNLGSLSALSNQMLTTSVKKGQSLTTSELTPSTSAVSLPKGMNAVTITMNGTQGLAGYLAPGDRVDVYGNLTKVSTGSSLPVPCTELAMSNIQVLDVQSTVPSYASHHTAAGRTIPTSETLLLAVTPSQARTIEFLSQNESLSVVQTQSGVNSVPLNQCIGTQ